MGAIVGAFITYLLAFAPDAGSKALTLEAVSVGTERARRRLVPVSPSKNFLRDRKLWPSD